MKKLILILFIGIVSCTQPKKDSIVAPIPKPIDTQNCDSLGKKYDSLIAVLKASTDSILQSNKSLRSKLNATYDSNKVYRATQIQLNRFMDICIKDPSQLVFLKGWRNRAERIK